MIRRVPLVGTNVSEERFAYMIRAFFRSVLWLLVTVSIVPVLLILVTLMMEPIPSSETSVLPRARRNIQKGGILHSHRRVNLKSCITYYVHHIKLYGWSSIDQHILSGRSVR
jgi:hypothetical protein